jgi:hypothetical protein
VVLNDPARGIDVAQSLISMGTSGISLQKAKLSSSSPAKLKNF